jgi:hypothetical protein
VVGLHLGTHGPSNKSSCPKFVDGLTLLSTVSILVSIGNRKAHKSLPFESTAKRKTHHRASRVYYERCWIQLQGLKISHRHLICFFYTFKSFLEGSRPI